MCQFRARRRAVGKPSTVLMTRELQQAALGGKRKSRGTNLNSSQWTRYMSESKLLYCSLAQNCFSDLPPSDGWFSPTVPVTRWGDANRKHNLGMNPESLAFFHKYKSMLNWLSAGPVCSVSINVQTAITGVLWYSIKLENGLNLWQVLDFFFVWIVRGCSIMMDLSDNDILRECKSNWICLSITTFVSVSGCTVSLSLTYIQRCCQYVLVWNALYKLTDTTTNRWTLTLIWILLFTLISFHVQRVDS